jgi:hypothetical protein
MLRRAPIDRLKIRSFSDVTRRSPQQPERENPSICDPGRKPTRTKRQKSPHRGEPASWLSCRLVRKRAIVEVSGALCRRRTDVPTNSARPGSEAARPRGASVISHSLSRFVPPGAKKKPPRKGGGEFIFGGMLEAALQAVRAEARSLPMRQKTNEIHEEPDRSPDLRLLPRNH